jgi:hypothetical protein
MTRQPSTPKQSATTPVTRDVADAGPSDASTTRGDPVVVLDALLQVLADDRGRWMLPRSMADITPATLDDALATDEVRVRLWDRMLDQLRSLDAPSAYVGSFHRGLDEALRLAAMLDPNDRPSAALFFVDCAARNATTEKDFRLGIQAARWLHPMSFSPHLAFTTVLQTCLPHVHIAPRPPASAYGLRVTLELLAGSRNPAIEPPDQDLIEEALRQVTFDDTAELSKMIDRLHPTDRRIAREIFGLDAGHHIADWRHRAQRSG